MRRQIGIGRSSWLSMGFHTSCPGILAVVVQCWGISGDTGECDGVVECCDSSDNSGNDKSGDGFDGRGDDGGVVIVMIVKMVLVMVKVVMQLMLIYCEVMGW